MQLLLNLDERKIVTRALEKCLSQAQGDSFKQKREMANRLLDRILEPHLQLSADELEDLSAILASCRIEVRRRISAEENPEAKTILEQQQKILDHASDKVTEACMMA